MRCETIASGAEMNRQDTMWGHAGSSIACDFIAKSKDRCTQMAPNGTTLPFTVTGTLLRFAFADEGDVSLSLFRGGSI
jgi:hypothetical protein